MLSDRDRARTGPRSMKVTGSPEWCWQTLDFFKNALRQVDEEYRQAGEVLDELRQARAWEKVPPEAPYGSLDAMLHAETGMDPAYVVATCTGGMGAGQVHHRAQSELLNASGSPRSSDDYTTSYRDAAAALWGDAGAYVHDSYDRQRHLFPELPEQLPIVIGITAYGKCLGATVPTWTSGPRITIASNLFKQGANIVDDVMVHDMAHAWLGITDQHTKHNGEPWYAVIRRLSPVVLGHDLDVHRGGDRKSVRMANARAGEPGQPATVVRKVHVDDAIPHEKVATWPYSFRPADYPHGDVIHCPSY